MANEELFASKAVNYAKGRKSYAPEERGFFPGNSLSAALRHTA